MILFTFVRTEQGCSISTSHSKYSPLSSVWIPIVAVPLYLSTSSWGTQNIGIGLCVRVLTTVNASLCNKTFASYSANPSSWNGTWTKDGCEHSCCYWTKFKERGSEFNGYPALSRAWALVSSLTAQTDQPSTYPTRWRGGSSEFRQMRTLNKLIKHSINVSSVLNYLFTHLAYEVDKGAILAFLYMFICLTKQKHPQVISSSMHYVVSLTMLRIFAEAWNNLEK